MAPTKSPAFENVMTTGLDWPLPPFNIFEKRINNSGIHRLRLCDAIRMENKKRLIIIKDIAVGCSAQSKLWQFFKQQNFATGSKSSRRPELLIVGFRHSC